MNADDEYVEFADRMEKKFPKMFSGQYGGFSVGKGWYPILENLCQLIQNYIDWCNKTRKNLLKDNPHNLQIPKEVEQVVVIQVKEKFGGLRFYYNGGDEHVMGLVSMAEAWAGSSCEECGKPGKARNTGWIKTLCDEHSA